ncbi:MAG: murein L,D-transpeptidase, partial [Vicinamibacterales bacterium]
MSGSRWRRERRWRIVGTLVLLAGIAHPGAQADLWLAPDGGASHAAQEALALLAAAPTEGLRSDAYGAAPLAAAGGRLREAAPDEIARFQRELTAAMSRYLRDVHAGRIDPRELGFQLDVPRDDHDFEALVAGAARTDTVRALAASFRPPYPQYQRLIEALARYRVMSAAAYAAPAPDVQGAVRSGDRGPAVAWIRARLTALGDADPGPHAADAETFDPSLEAAVQRFQRRHGLDADGVVGAGTFAALRVPVAARVAQIELALERLRWLPHQRHARVIVINIPMFQLWGWNGTPAAGDPAFQTGVIVGRAVSTRTPVMAKAIRDVVFRPYWNVPRSIVLGEIRPALAANPEYLLDNDMELVQGDGDGAPVVEVSPENLERLWRGDLRVRQRPGPRNALGLVKFVFPNDENVYMHATPAQALFGRARRDFSHGCVRVQDPVALAEWVLAGEPGWTRERIQEAMGGSDTQVVRLAEPIDVLLFYTTTVVAGDGTVRFA